MPTELPNDIRILISRAADRNEYESEAGRQQATKELHAALYTHFNAKEGDQYIHEYLPHGDVVTLVGFDRHWDNPEVMYGLLTMRVVCFKR